MRLYLLPISSRRTLLYCQRMSTTISEKESWVDKATSKAAKLWSGWENKESGWQKTAVHYGNHIFRRIPYEEWGLKTVPPLSKRKKKEEMQGNVKAEVIFPKSLIALDGASRILERLSTERDALHRKKLRWCIIGMPITAPIGILPVVPNIPFFYLLYRAWSHWRAIEGGKHIQYLLQKSLLSLSPSPLLDEVYMQQKFPLPSTTHPTTESTHTPSDEFPGNSDLASRSLPDEPEKGEAMLLSQAAGRKIAQELELPQLEIEVERAIWQVETAIEQSRAQSRAEADTDKKKSS